MSNPPAPSPPGRYAITGATGFLGGVLARQLRDAGHDVVALVRDPARAQGLTAAGVRPVRGDLDDAAALDELCRDADALFHVAGWYKVGSRTPKEGYRARAWPRCCARSPRSRAPGHR